jgi:predicted transposase YdaD
MGVIDNKGVNKGGNKEVNKEEEQKGRIEGKIETARLALQAGVNLKTISQITGLEQATIHKLKEEQEQYNKA